MPPAARPALDKVLDSTLNAVPSVPRFPLLLGFAVDQRMSSFISLTTALETLIISFTFFKSSSYALVNIVTCEPNCWLLPRVLPGQLPHLLFQTLDLPGQPPLIPLVLLAELRAGARR